MMVQDIHPTKRVHIIVTGKVQGVGFRAYIQRSATILGLSGWVRNVGYNQVETVAEGISEIINSFVEAVRTGPRSARLDDLNLNWEEPLNDSKKFEIRFG